MTDHQSVTNVAQGVQAFTSNAFLVPGDRTVLVDAGANFDVVSTVRERVDDLDALVLTHTHRDHVGNLGDVVEAFDVDVWGFDTDQAGVDHAIADGETVALGDGSYLALHTPGHKDDHLCFYDADAGVLFAGDLVFQNGSFGRTDLEEGDRGLLVESIERLLDHLDPDLGEMHVGHGPSVYENPYSHVELALEMADTGPF
jgi:glyoxylase-like metal-dependent hydrolase (beta-lactamase superfamily II)